MQNQIVRDAWNLIDLVREILPFANGLVIAWLAHRRYAADKQHEYDYRMLHLRIARLRREVTGTNEDDEEQMDVR